MSGAGGPGSQTDGIGLLERAISYALDALQAVTPALLSRPTPCEDWDLRMLLQHVNESLAALYEGFDAGSICLDPAADDGDLTADPAPACRERARQLLAASATAYRADRLIAIAGCPLTASVLAGAGALEVAVHGWDISQACGHRQPIPYPLAVDLLRICPLLVTDATRPRLFADPVTVSPPTGPSDRLVALLGRSCLA